MTFVPPIKSQGIKTKLVDWISSNTTDLEYERWVEPFMGTGVVAFNIRPKKALLCDSNPHLIRFYQAIQKQEITAPIVRNHLTKEGENLLKSKGEYYYEVRERFNKEGNSLDFLFLSRSCFNGMMRFNKKGGFNVPFCKKPNRFAQALVTKITNQVDNISQIIQLGDYVFQEQDFQQTLQQVNSQDLIYADPPYLGRHVDYFDSWSETNELNLKQLLSDSGANFILSTWLKSQYRINQEIFSTWKDCYVAIKEHFYHVGASEKNRNAIYEALVSNILLLDSISNSEMKVIVENNKQSTITTEKSDYQRDTQLLLKFDDETMVYQIPN